MDVEAAAGRQFDSDEILPWEHLGGPGKEYLLGHLEKAMEASREAGREISR
jgi:hypothetical protein